MIASLLLLLAADPPPCFADGERVGVRDPRLRDPACAIPVGVVLTASIVEVRPVVALSVYPPCAGADAWIARELPTARAYFLARGVAPADVSSAIYACVPAPRIDARVLDLPYDDVAEEPTRGIGGEAERP